MTFDIDALHAQALELVLRRAGLRTLCADARRSSTSRLARALRALEPRAVVLTGRRGVAGRDRPARLRGPVGAIDDVAVFDYRGAVPDTGASTVSRLGDRPLKARDAIVAHLDARAWGRMPATRGA